MAQKQKQRPSPLDDPPTASSSDSEEEDQQPSSQQHDAEEEEEEEVSSEEEEEVSSEEEEEDQPSSPPQPASKNPPPPPTNSHPKPSSSESDTESGSESEPDPHPAPAANPKVKPLASKPMDQAQKPKAQPSPKSGSKRAVENNAHVTDAKRAKRKITDSSSSAAAAVASDEEMEEDGKKSGDHLKKFQRLWSEEDELAILKGMVDFTSKTGQDPLKYANAFHDFMKKLLHVEASSNQLKEKIRRLKKKFETNAGKGKNGEGPRFSKPHDQKAFELSKKVWGNEQVGGAAEKSKSNGKVAKSPKKEASTRNVASAKKSKPETKPEPEPEPASVDLKESGKMDIDQKPAIDVSLLLSEMAHFQKGVSVYGLNEDEVKRGLELMGESNRAELEGKWKKLRLAEMEVFANRAQLIGEQTRLILEALDSSNH